MNKQTRNPWSWVPSLYFAEGIPYVIAATTFSLIMYKRLGISNTDAALYTSWLYLPWVIKPFWSPFVDIMRTKRWWIVAMQLLIGGGLAGVAFCIPTPFYLQSTLAILWLIAFSSATHDIAADGFYMLALDENKQSLFVGIRSTFYRIAMIAGQGLLVILAGTLESSSGLEPVTISVSAGEGSATKQCHTPGMEDLHFSYTGQTAINPNEIDKDSLSGILNFIKENNIKNGFIPSETPTTKTDGDGQGFWSTYVSSPLKSFLSSTFNTNKPAIASDMAPNAEIFAISLSGKPQKPVVLNFSQTKGDKTFRLLGNDRITFTSENWEQPAYIAVQIDPKADSNATAEFTGTSGNIPFAWSLTFYLCAGLFIAFAIYHKFVLPRPDADKTVRDGNAVKSLFSTFGSFFSKKGIALSLAFILLYRLGEAQLTKIASPFLIDDRMVGGLGLSTAKMGVIYGTIGVIALTAGGILGGIAASRHGLKRWIWPMILCMNLPNLVYVYMAFALPESFITISTLVGIEQFGYGFGFTAFMLYLIFISQGKYSTSHYAICTGFMALGMMLPGMIAGWLQETIGYQNFFIWVCICTIPGFLLARKLNISTDFGKKKE
ncbi:MAG: MFS transporter [Paludibacteraceae bacterium]